MMIQFSDRGYEIFISSETFGEFLVFILINPLSKIYSDSKMSRESVPWPLISLATSIRKKVN